MFELTKEEIKYLLSEYNVTKKSLKIISLAFSSYGFVKTKEEYFLLCETACYRYQSSSIDNEYLHSRKEKGYRINMNDVILDALKEIYEEPEDLNYVDQEELKSVKVRLITDKTTH